MNSGKTRRRAAIWGGLTGLVFMGALVGLESQLHLVSDDPGAAIVPIPAEGKVVAALEPAELAELMSERAPGARDALSYPSLLQAPDSSAPKPETAVLKSKLAPLLSNPALGSGVSLEVRDVWTGEPLLSVDAQTARTPASTLKILTGAAALSALGPETTLTTEVVRDGDSDEITLVAGGDVLMGTGVSSATRIVGRGSLRELAEDTAQALKDAGQTSVVLHLDDTLFEGPVLSSQWKPDDVTSGFVAPVYALQINAGRITSEKYAPRQSDPSMVAAEKFKQLLGEYGIAVQGTLLRDDAPAEGTRLAAVQSATITELVQLMLVESDNTVAEALSRLVAVKNSKPATFAGGSEAVMQQLKSLGVNADGVVMAGGSGLGRGNQASAEVFTQILAAAARPASDPNANATAAAQSASANEAQRLGALVSLLPVAGATGTLEDRFATSGQAGARGLVRAKTGTLSGVSSLAGTVVDADGRFLAFSILADQGAQGAAAQVVIDDIVSAIASCGCR